MYARHDEIVYTANDGRQFLGYVLLDDGTGLCHVRLFKSRRRITTVAVRQLRAA